ncbi:MAG: helix-turn-helix transcriptional regulator [Myxococcaceae bacterium]|nr:helix-turn-helix transcriptional regulator [Myxococcaceae bacterium]
MRQQLGWTQLALAARARISRDTIHRLERGRVIDVSSLIALLGAMGQRVAFEEKPQLRAADIRRKFAPLHEDDE